jgi:hypothetical protein
MFIGRLQYSFTFNLIYLYVSVSVTHTCRKSKIIKKFFNLYKKRKLAQLHAHVGTEERRR